MSDNNQNNFDEFELWIHDQMNQEFETSPIVMSEDLLRRTLKAVKEDEQAVQKDEDRQEDPASQNTPIELADTKNVLKTDEKDKKNNKITFIRGLRTFAILAASIVLVVMAFKVNNLFNLGSNNSVKNMLTTSLFDETDGADTSSVNSGTGEVTREAELESKTTDDSDGYEMYGASPEADTDTQGEEDEDTSDSINQIAAGSNDNNNDTDRDDVGITATSVPEENVSASNDIEAIDNVSWISNIAFTEVDVNSTAATYGISEEEMEAEQALYQTAMNISVIEDISEVSSNYAISSLVPYNNAEGALVIDDLIGWIGTFTATGYETEINDQDVFLRVLLLENTDHILYLKAGGSGSISIEDLGIDGSVLSGRSGFMDDSKSFVTQFTNWLGVIDESKLQIQEVKLE